MSNPVIVDNYCSSISPAHNGKGKMPLIEASFADEILVYDLGSEEYIIYEGFETNGAFGYFTLNKQLEFSSTCTGYGHICAVAIDPNLTIAETSGYTYNYVVLSINGRGGGWWIGAQQNQKRRWESPRHQLLHGPRPSKPCIGKCKYQSSFSGSSSAVLPLKSDTSAPNHSLE